MFKKYKFLSIFVLLLTIIIIGFLSKKSFAEEYAWTYQTKGSETSDNWFTAPGSSFTDSEGNSYLPGVMYGPGSVDFNGETEGGILTLEEGSNPYPYILKINKDGVFQWVKKIDNTLDGTENYSSMDYLTIDKNNDFVYVSGNFNGAIDFNPGNPGGELNTSSAKFSPFITKMTIAGEYVWTQKIETEVDYPLVTFLEVDSLGNIYVFGEFSGNVDFDPLNEGGEKYSTVRTSYLLKLNPSGNFVWVKTIDSMEITPGAGGSYPEFIKIDNNNNIFLSGRFQGLIDVNPGAEEYQLELKNSSINDIFILKLNAEGDFVWAKTINKTSEDLDGSGYTSSLEINENGANLYVMGGFSGYVYMYGEEGSTIISKTISGNDVFIYKLHTSDGSLIWAKSYGGEGHDKLYSASLDSSENLYASGYFETSADFDPSETDFILNTSSTLQTPYILKLNRDGLFEWVKKIDGNNLTTDDYFYIYSNSLDSEDNLYIQGYASGNAIEGKTYDFNPGAPDERLGIITSYALEDSFLIKINADVLTIEPTVSSPTSSDITRTSASILSSVTNSGGEEPSAVGFQYGLDTNYGTTLTSNNLGGSFSYDFSDNLTCNTTYHFRSYAENSAGRGYSTDSTFTTEKCVSVSRVVGSRSSSISNFFKQQNNILTENKAEVTVTTTPSNYNFGTTLLKQGLRNTFVKELQRFLNNNLKLNLVEDGIFGPMTKTAVIAFQKANGLKPDGIVGPLTREKMK